MPRSRLSPARDADAFGKHRRHMACVDAVFGQCGLLIGVVVRDVRDKRNLYPYREPNGCRMVPWECNRDMRQVWFVASKLAITIRERER